MTTKHTLFLSSSSDPSSPLAVDKEYNRVREKLESVNVEWSNAVDYWPDIKLDQLHERLYDYRPVVVHFSGHGRDNGALVMRDHNGKSGPMHPDGLASLFGAFKSSLRLMVLNACYSEALAVKLVEHIDVVVGMRSAVTDAAAILFAPSFYRVLAKGGSVAEAFNQAKSLIQARYNQETNIPQLLLRDGVDPEKLFIPGEVAPNVDSDSAKAAPSAPTAHSVPDIGPLTRPQKDGLVNLLLNSRYMTQANLRDEVLAALRQELFVQISILPNPRATISSLVNTCDRYPGGIVELIDALRPYEQGTRQMNAIDAWLRTVGA